MPRNLRQLWQLARGQQSDREIALEAAIADLVWGVHLWASEEDDQVYDAALGPMIAALETAGIPFTVDTNESGDRTYLLDHDWCDGMRRAWRDQPWEKR